MAQQPQRLLRWMLWIFQALLAHANWALEEIVHFILRREIPFVSLVPEAHNHLAAVEEAVLVDFRHRVCLVPYKILERVKLVVERLVPFADKIVARENKRVAVWLQYALEFIDEIERINRLEVPFAEVVVDGTATREIDVARRIFCDVVRRIGQDEVDGMRGNFCEVTLAIVIDERHGGRRDFFFDCVFVFAFRCIVYRFCLSLFIRFACLDV